VVSLPPDKDPKDIPVLHWLSDKRYVGLGFSAYLTEVSMATHRILVVEDDDLFAPCCKKDCNAMGLM
jgi:hypothetical protein